jgi:hypothetical protein
MVAASNKQHPQFSFQCFWDQDSSKLDYDDAKNYIITRVVSYGSSDDEAKLFAYYGWDVVKEEVVKIRYLNKKILNYLSVIFEIPKEDFRCFNNQGIF